MMSYTALEILLGYSRMTISRAISYLEKHNWIQIIKIGKSNAYLINSGAFWQNYGDRKMTSFSAQIIGVDTEQTKTIEELQKVKLKHFPVVEVTEQVVLGNNELPDPPCNEELEV